jgi:ubiquinone/menaquinone biosynthesis C-methylase UbiE
MDLEQSTTEWYEHYHQRRGGIDRNTMRTNPGILFQLLAWEVCIVRAIYNIKHETSSAKILDVGCGNGSEIYLLIRLSYSPSNITGIDIQEIRVSEARKLYPQINFVHGDASKMEFDSNSFDLIYESTMFATLPDDNLSLSIAREMMRVCKPDGYILLVDWRTPNPFDRNYKALTRKRLNNLFAVGKDTNLLGVYKGALVPPIGRFLSSHLPSFYFMVGKISPFLVGQVSYLLRKRITQ